MLIEGNALKIRTIRSILVKSGDIGQNFRTLSFSERCFDTQTNNNLKKAMMSMFVDYDSDIQELEKYYEQLIEHGLVVIIGDSKGNQFATTPQTVFNWEYKMWTRWSNRKYQENKRNEIAKQKAIEKELDEKKNTPFPAVGEVPTERIDDSLIPAQNTTETTDKSSFVDSIKEMASKFW